LDSAGQYVFCQRWIDAKQVWLEGRRAEFALALLSLSLAHPILTARRLALAVPNVRLNRALRRFYAGIEG
jgi:hypothetical protein